jgi:pentatricopeptide repeat protein
MLLDEMPRGGAVPSVMTYNAMITGYCKAGRMQDALGIKELMERNGCRPDDWTYGILIHGLCDGKIDEAERFLDSAVKGGFTPTVVTFTNLIDGYCKAERIDDALRVKNNMMLRKCKLDINVYGKLINSLIKKDRLKEANMLLTEILTAGLVPNVVTYTSLLMAIARSGKLIWH